MIQYIGMHSMPQCSVQWCARRVSCSWYRFARPYRKPLWITLFLRIRFFFFFFFFKLKFTWNWHSIYRLGALGRSRTSTTGTYSLQWTFRQFQFCHQSHFYSIVARLLFPHFMSVNFAAVTRHTTQALLENNKCFFFLFQFAINVRRRKRLNETRKRRRRRGRKRIANKTVTSENIFTWIRVALALAMYQMYETKTIRASRSRRRRREQKRQ